MAILSRTYYLGIGSNIQPRSHIGSCLLHLKCAFRQVRISPTYQTAAFGFDGLDFLNLVVEVKTGFEPMAFKQWLQRLEDSHGRDRSQPRYSNRSLDIDLLLCDDRVLKTPTLELPRPEILKRHYVLKPLQDLAPDLIHPTQQKRLSDLWKALAVSDPHRMRTVTDLDW